MSLRSAWLTWKIHRFEVVAAAALAAVLAGSAWVVAAHLNGIVVGSTCWAQWEGSGGSLNACQRLVEAWLDVNEHEAGRLTGFLSYLPVAIGVILGVPIVARELELRTVSLAWSLQGVRWRWLLARLWPMLVIVLVGGLLVAVTASEMRVAQASSPFEEGYLWDIARQGPVLFSRVLVGFGVGVLAGAVVGRTLPAFLVGGLLALAWLIVGGTLVEQRVAESYATYVAQDQMAADDGTELYHPLEWLGGGYKDPTGRIIEGDLNSKLCGPDETGEETCPDPFPPEGYELMVRIVPMSAWVPIEQADSAASLIVAGVAVLLAFPVVARRRPG
jgi:hypothetical protein